MAGLVVVVPVSSTSLINNLNTPTPTAKETTTTTTTISPNLTLPQAIIPVPQETLESIIDYLRDDHASLLACSLVASRMLPRCRFHIFADLTLDCVGIEGFMKLLEAPHCSLGMSVERMTLTGVRMAGSMRPLRATTTMVTSAGDRGPGGGDGETKLARLYHMLANVRTLRLVHISLSDIQPSFFHALHQLKSIKEVVVQDVACHSPSQIFGLIGSLPGIEKLSIARLSSASMIMPKPTEAEVSMKMPSLDKVTIPLVDFRKYAFQHYDPTMSVMVLEWMMGHQNPPVEIEEMRFSVDAGNAVVGLLKRYWEMNGASVKGLCVSLPPSSSALRRIPSVDISPCSELERLEIEGLRTSHPLVIQTHLEGYLKSLLTQLLLPLGTGQNRSKDAVFVNKMVPLKTISFGVEMDRRVSAHATTTSVGDALQMFGWCGLAPVVEGLLEKSGLTTTRVVLKVDMGGRGGDYVGIENGLRGGVWKGMNDLGRLDVVFESSEDMK